MKRMALYDAQSRLLWEGGVCDMPLDPAVVRAEFKRLFADCSCPERLNSVKEMLRTQVLLCGSPLTPEAAGLLAYKTAARYVLSES